ncbi:hypothetical protein MMC31_005628 [Peltigera leucophlebia]|nr:hypothetical protein [Peltigera leucophlebia]
MSPGAHLRHAETCKTYSSPETIYMRPEDHETRFFQQIHSGARRPLLDASIDLSTSLRRTTRSSAKTTQAQVGRSPETATVHFNSPEPVQQSLTASQSLTELLQSARRKREREPEVRDKPLDKRQRTELGPVVEWA